MSVLEKVRTFVTRCGAPAKFVAKSLVGVAVPGSGPVLDLIDKLIDCAHETAKDNLEALASRADLERIEKMFDVMLGDLQDVVEHLRRLEDVPDLARKTLYATLRNEEHCLSAARALEEQAVQLSVVRVEVAKLSAGQDDLRDLQRRHYRTMLDYIEEQRQHNVSAAQLDERLRRIEDGIRALHAGSHDRAEAVFAGMSAQQPESAALAVAEAASQAAGFAFERAAQSLGRAARLRPGDIQLAEMSRIATNRSRGATPVDPRPDAIRRPKPGDTLDGWVLEELLGRGGWGQVFLARKGEFRGALKIMHAELSLNAEFERRFKREMVTLAGLGAHPHLVRIDPDHLFGKAADWNCWYYVMEYIEGYTLERYLTERGALRIAQARGLFSGIAEGLAAAHARGIVHRDIKPANILIRRKPQAGQGQGVLVDFGLAGVVDLHSRGAGYTAGFAAPEQFRHGVSDCRSDVYSLAATIYFCLLHGEADKRGRFKAKLLPADVPADVRDLLERCLDNDPDERPQNGAAFVQEWCNTRIINVCSKNFGRVVVEEEGGIEKKKVVYFIKRSTPVPAKYMEQFDTQFDNQTRMDIEIIEAEGAVPPIDPSDPVCRTIKVVHFCLPPGLPKGHPLLVTYSLGEDGKGLRIQMMNSTSDCPIDEMVYTFDAITEQDLVENSDVVSHSLGLIALSPDRSRYINAILIAKNQPIPCSIMVPWKIRTQPGGGNEIELYPTQGESENPSACSFLGKYCFTDVTHVADGAIIDFTYGYDQIAFVKLSGTERATGKTLPMRVEPIPEDMSWLHRPPVPPYSAPSP